MTDYHGEEYLDFLETRMHGTPDFPIQITTQAALKGLMGPHQIIPHWHPELELLFMDKGSCTVGINDDSILLKEGDALLVNSNMLHQAHVPDGKEGQTIISLLVFNPTLIYGWKNSAVCKKYFLPFSGRQAQPYFYFSKTISWQKNITELIQEIHRIHSSQQDDFELSITISLIKIYRLLYRNALNVREPGSRILNLTGIEQIKEMLSYIAQHYHEKIKLADLAGFMGFSQSECYRMFIKYLNQSPFDYIIDYRLRQSASLLMESHQPIVEIAQETGFSSQSYYAKCFKKKYGCTPKEYRKRISLPEIERHSTGKF